MSTFHAATDLRKNYIRQASPFCPGCGHGILTNCFVRAWEQTAIPRDQISDPAG